MSAVARPFNAPNCWSRQYEDGDMECEQCHHKASCKQQFLALRGMQPTAVPTPPPSAWQHRTPSASPPQQVHLPVYPVVGQHVPTPLPPVQQTAVNNSQFWQTNQTPYFSPMEGESIGERLLKTLALTIGASFFDMLAQFFKSWRWPKT